MEWHNLDELARVILDCGRKRSATPLSNRRKSGVALRLPPQSKSVQWQALIESDRSLGRWRSDVRPLSPRHDNRAPYNQHSSQVMLPGQPLSQHHRGQHDGEHDAQFVHRRDSGCLAELKRAKIAEPG